MGNIVNRSNGHGYELYPPHSITHGEYIFGEVGNLVDQARIGPLLIVGDPGAGKDHLVKDLVAQASREGLPSMALHAHISGGKASGAENAEREINAFADTHGCDGLLVINNADYFAYSRSDGRRSIGLARKHRRVAGTLMSLIDDPNCPLLLATAHSTTWRDAHWRFGKKYGDADDVTPVNKRLLEKFPQETVFTGDLTEDVAEKILTGVGGFDLVAAKKAIQELKSMSYLSWRYVSRISPAENVRAAAEAIHKEYLALLGGAAAKSYVSLPN